MRGAGVFRIKKARPIKNSAFYSGGADQARTDETVMVAGAGVFRIKKVRPIKNGAFYSGGADQARTDDPLLAKQVLYQLSYNPRTLRLKAGALPTELQPQNFATFL